jgi:nucleoid DNA-binding protein
MTVRWKVGSGAFQRGSASVRRYSVKGRLDNGPWFREFQAIMAKKTAALKERLSKTQILEQIAASTELSRKQVSAVLDSLTEVIGAHLDKKSVGEFVLPGLLKISTVKKPAVKARKGISPFTKEEVIFKAKPASTVVKVRALKKLKDMAL